VIPVDDSFDKEWMSVLFCVKGWHLVTLGIFGDLRIKYVASDVVCELVEARAKLSLFANPGDKK